jgi:hypothetical protein
VFPLFIRCLHYHGMLRMQIPPGRSVYSRITLQRKKAQLSLL